MTYVQDVQQRWRTAMVGLLVAVMFGATLIFAPTASAGVSAGYQNWGTVAPADSTNLADAWSWNGTGWAPFHAGLVTSSRAYIYPFATGWSWAWTTDSGWVAVQSADLDPGFGTCSPSGAYKLSRFREGDPTTVWVARSCHGTYILEHYRSEYAPRSIWIDYLGALSDNKGCRGTTHLNVYQRYIRTWSCPSGSGYATRSTWNVTDGGFTQLS